MDCRKLLKSLPNKTQYQPITDLGLDNLTTASLQDDYRAILNTITDYTNNLVNQISLSNKTFLDVGCSFGYFCFQLTKLGARTIGIDKNPDFINVCKCLSKRYKFSTDNPLFINANIHDHISEIQNVDYVLLLNIFHHLLTKDEDLAWRTFNILLSKSKAVFVMIRPNWSQYDWKLGDGTQDGVGDAIIAKSDAIRYVKYPAVLRRNIYVFEGD